ncbi:MAG: LrgB family protein [Pseudomonadota bacterium]|nr:LrgB family protein [Pseudomonadota bacterium]
MVAWQILWERADTRTLLGLLLTLTAYRIGLWGYQASGRNPILHPAIVAIALLISLLTVLDVPYETYFSGAYALHFLLGPATVALGVPLYQNFTLVRQRAKPIVLGLLAGAITAPVSAVLIAHLLGGDSDTLRSMAPKSVTTPIAIELAEQIGGLPSLAAAMVLLTGVFGCLLAPGLYRWLGIRDPAAQGFALGVSAHGFGTVKAFEWGPTAGAFAALGLGMTGIVTASLLPLTVQWLAAW